MDIEVPQQNNVRREGGEESEERSKIIKKIFVWLGRAIDSSNDGGGGTR